MNTTPSSPGRGRLARWIHRPRLGRGDHTAAEQAVRDDDPVTEQDWHDLDEWFAQQDAARAPTPPQAEAARVPTPLEDAEDRLGLARSDLGHARAQMRTAYAYGWVAGVDPVDARAYLDAAIRERDEAAAAMAHLTGRPLDHFRDHAVPPRATHDTSHDHTDQDTNADTRHDTEGDEDTDADADGS